MSEILFHHSAFRGCGGSKVAVEKWMKTGSDRCGEVACERLFYLRINGGFWC